MFVKVTAENGTTSVIRAETFVDAVSYFQKCHPDVLVVSATRATTLRPVLEGCYDNAEEQLNALLIALEAVDDDGVITRSLAEAIYCDCVGTECAEFVEPKKD
jgi:hypothetical protein